MHTLRTTASLAVFSLVAAASANAQSTSIPSVIVTVENAQPGRGVFLTPPWIGIHDGSFDSYDGGAPASVPLGGNEIEALAEDGNNGPITATFASLLPNAPQVMGVAGPTGPLAPGQRSSVTLNVDPLVDRYFSYASMVIPSNDAFIANGNPLAHVLFDASGRFVGQGFIVSGDETNDAGTEVNDEIAGNVAFLAQAAPNTGTPENGLVVTPSPSFAAPGTLAYPDGVLNYPAFGNGDFNDADDRLLEVSFRFVDLGGTVFFGGQLDSMQLIQPSLVDSAGFGTIQAFTVDAQRAGILVNTEGLSGPITTAYLRRGQAGTSGEIIGDLSAGIIGNGSAVRILVDANALTGSLAGAPFLDLANEMAAGNVHITLHTAQHPMGEVRGQIELAN